MKIRFLLFLLMSTGIFLHAQTIKGTVVDKQSQYVLPGAKILVVGSDPVIGAISDQEGDFRLEGLPFGRQSLQISFIGYETVTLSNLMVISGKELNLNVELVEKIVQLDDVVISAQDDKRQSLNQMATVSSRTMSIEEAGRYAGSLQDPARMAQNFAGVSGANDARNDIIIRGNSPIGVLWRMEGIDIPSPNHFASLGTTGGPVSMLNLNNLQNSDFMTSAWSADYGNALSGVFDLKLRKGNRDKREYIFQVGFNGFELGAEGPFVKGKKASYIFNYRYSTLGLMSALGIDLGTGTAVPQYQDITFKINLPTQKAGRFSIFGIGGVSFIEFDTDSSETDNLYFAPNTKARFGSKTGIIGVSHNYFFNEKTYSKLVIAASGTVAETTIDSTQNNQIVHFFGQNNQQMKYSLNYKINRKFNARNTASVGIIYDYYNFYLRDSVKDGSSFLTSTDFSGGTSLLQSYVQWQHKFTDQLTLNSGLHLQHFLLNSSTAIEPRLGLRYKLNSKHSLNLGAGLHSQMQMVTTYFYEDEINGQTLLPNKNLDFTRTLHSVIGHDFFIGKDFRLKTEAYYQYLYNVPVDTLASSYSMLNQGSSFANLRRVGLENTGKGYNYGLEFTLEKFYSKGYYFLLTTSLFQSKYQGSDGIWRNTTFNSNYVINALGGKEFKIGEKATLAFDTKVTYAGGRWESPIDLATSQLANEEVRIETRAFSVQNAAYFRTDFKITFRMNHKKMAQQFSVDLQNVSNYKNVFLSGYNTATGQIGTSYQRGFFPDVNYKLWF